MQNIYRINLQTCGANYRYMIDADTAKDAVKIAREITEARGASLKGAKITYEIIFER